MKILSWNEIAAELWRDLKAEGGFDHARAVLLTLDFRLNMNTNRWIGKPRPPATAEQREREEKLFQSLLNEFGPGGINIIVRRVLREMARESKSAKDSNH